MAAETIRWPRRQYDGRGDNTMICGYDGVGVGGRLSMLWLWGE